MSFVVRVIFLVMLVMNAFAAIDLSERTIFDKDGFARCYQKNGKVYFFDWDHAVRTPEKVVSYIEIQDYIYGLSHSIKSCNDYKYLKEIPTELLRDISELQNILPEIVLFSLQQVSNGGHIFRAEKTAAEYIANRKDIFKAKSPEIISSMRHNVGDKFTNEVLKFFTEKIAVKDKSCDSLIGSCDFYLCQEQKNPCGLDGYNLSKGYKYCSDSKFNLLDKMSTPMGKAWVTGVIQCLQKKSLNISSSVLVNENTCQNILKESYSSHPDCYVQAGFCQLEKSERHHIYSTIKNEILSFRTLIQGLAVLKQCAKEN